MPSRKKPNMGAAQELKNIVDRIVALNVERKTALAEFDEDIEGIYTEAENKGFDVKALKLAVRRRHETPEQRAKRYETEALADMYSAAIGDLAGKPLDDLTRRRIDEQMRRQQPQGISEPDPQSELPPEAVQPQEPSETAEQAREKGKQARRDGKRVVDNPYHSSSPLRAAWDEGWCEEDGSDGMDIPAAWRRDKKREDETKGDGKDGEQQSAAPPGGQSANGGGEPQEHQQA
jgi:uncharacterized protein (UPF0335 family)